MERAPRNVRAAWLDATWQDVRSSAITLRRRPAFAATSILVLALGIGVATAIFSVVNAVFFRSLGLERPEELVYLYQVLPRHRQIAITGYPDLEFFRQGNTVFAGLTAHWGLSMPFTIDGQTTSLPGEQVAANYFDVLGVRPVLGRTFTSAEDDPATTELAIVISYGLWQRRFGSASDVVGRTVQVGGHYIGAKTFTVVGVAPADFRGLSDPWSPTEFWVTSVQYHGADYRTAGVGLIGRLAPGVTLEQARAAIAVLNEQLFQERSRNWPAPSATAAARTANPALMLPVGDVRMPFDPGAEVVPVRLATAVSVVVALVLLVATSNVAGILRARGVARTGEIAVRRALGTSAFRLVRQLGTESLLLSFGSGLVGLLVAASLVGLYRAYTPDRFLVPVSLNVPVLLFAFVLCMVVGVLIALAPAVQALRVDVARALGGGPGATSRGRMYLRHGVVVPQVAASLILLLVAGVHSRSLMDLEMGSPGYDIDGLAVVDTWLSLPRPSGPRSPTQDAENAERHRRFYHQLHARVQRTVGAESVAVASGLPVAERSGLAPTYVSQDDLSANASDLARAFPVEVSEGYFRTVGIPLRRGRDFDARDLPGAPAVAIISESLAARMWPYGEALGKMLAQYDPERTSRSPRWLTVVGVAGDTAPILHTSTPTPLVYVPLSQQWSPNASQIVARVDDSRAAAVIANLNTAVTSSDRAGTVFRSRSMRQIVGDLLYPRRAAAGILLASGLLGLLLSAVGLYGVISYSVAQRLREISIRMAVGADHRGIVRLVLREALAAAVTGALIGLPLGLAALRTTATLVGPAPRVDASTFIIVPLLVWAVIVAACYLPAQRAARTDPATLLRSL